MVPDDPVPVLLRPPVKLAANLVPRRGRRLQRAAVVALAAVHEGKLAHRVRTRPANPGIALREGRAPSRDEGQRTVRILLMFWLTERELIMDVCFASDTRTQ